MPESTDSGQKGTVILSCNFRVSRPRSRPLSPWSISNSQVPLRQSQSRRTNCGRGYSGRGGVFLEIAMTCNKYQITRTRYMAELPNNLVQIQHIGARTRERMASDRDVAAFADCGLGLAGSSLARAGFTFFRPAPDMRQLLVCTGGRGE